MVSNQRTFIRRLLEEQKENHGLPREYAETVWRLLVTELGKGRLRCQRCGEGIQDARDMELYSVEKRRDTVEDGYVEERPHWSVKTFCGSRCKRVWVLSEKTRGSGEDDKGVGKA